ncbi:unnamed protein product [Ectocarpus sp. 4 AP-2014]
MNHQNSPWANDDGGFHHHHQQAAGTDPTPTPRERQGWLVAEQPAGVGGWGGSSGCGNQALDDAMDRFGGMTLGSNVAGSGDGGRADDLDMSSLRLAEGGRAGGSCLGLSAVAQNPFSSTRCQQQRQQPQRQQQQQPQQQHQHQHPPASLLLENGGMRSLEKRNPLGFSSPAAAAAAGATGNGGGIGVGCYSSCGVGRQQQLAGRGVGARRGPDGAWLDEEGRRLYTEGEVREAIEQEVRGWRDKSASLETSMANLETETKAALMRAEQAIAEMTEQLRAAEGKTYALSVHLAQSNRPPHLA